MLWKVHQRKASLGRYLKSRRHCPKVKRCSYLWSSENAADFDTRLSKSLIRKEIHCHENHVSSPSQMEWVSAWVPPVEYEGLPPSPAEMTSGGPALPLAPPAPFLSA